MHSMLLCISASFSGAAVLILLTHTHHETSGMRAAQEEVDKLTQRAKYAEGAFLDMYQKLYEAPDPAPALASALVRAAHMFCDTYSRSLLVSGWRCIRSCMWPLAPTPALATSLVPAPQRVRGSTV